MVQQMTEEVKLIREDMTTSQSGLKSYRDKSRKNLELEIVHAKSCYTLCGRYVCKKAFLLVLRVSMLWHWEEILGS